MCPVWEVIEYRTEFKKGDVEYIGNLCHDCGECYTVCPFVPPHEFNVDIPSALREVRFHSYQEYATPKIAGSLFNNQLLLSGVIASLSLISIIFLYLFTGNPARLFNAITTPGSFYVILPNIAIDTSGILLALFFIASWLFSGNKFLKKTSSSGGVRLTDILSALRDSFAGEWFKGGGAGCNYPVREERGSYRKLIVHSMVLYGFMLDLLATIAAFIEQDFFGILPPYPIFSVPVISGLSGGTLIIAGVVSFFYYDSIENWTKRGEVKTMDRTFLLSLLFTALTGILLLSFRGTYLMGTLLLIHLTVVSTLFITAPYGKFVHLVYRFLAIAKYHQEKRVAESART